jgi:hypothetical protein
VPPAQAARPQADGPPASHRAGKGEHMRKVRRVRTDPRAAKIPRLRLMHPWRSQVAVDTPSLLEQGAQPGVFPLTPFDRTDCTDDADQSPYPSGQGNSEGRVDSGR